MTHASNLKKTLNPFIPERIHLLFGRFTKKTMVRRSAVCLLLSLLLTSLSFAQNKQARITLDSKLAPFYHGVASGDPLQDRVILWTRITPGSGVAGTDTVYWRIASDTTFTTIVNSGYTFTDSTKDYTVKIDADGLSENTWYYYDFKTEGRWSPIGRTKTSPAAGIDSLRFALMSCANYESGYFVAYERVVNRNDLDAIIHVGDYIYEYEVGGYDGGNGRDHEPPTEILSLQDYRMRYSHYRLDQDLQCAHQQYPWMTVWDDHESADNSWTGGAENHNAGEGLWSDRKGYASQAYHEWMPIRTPDSLDLLNIRRKIRYGDLVDLMMVDTRLWGREEQAGTSGGTVTDPGRTLLGHDQFTWLTSELKDSTTQWKVIAQQVMMAPLTIFGIGFNGDQWDGYPAERQKLLDSIMINDIENVVVLTGDIHTAWANDLPWNSSYNPSTGANSAAVEFVVTSITSPGLAFPIGASLIQLANPHMKYIDLSNHGYVVLDINKTRTQADYYFVGDINAPSYTDSHDDGWYVNNGERWLNNAGSPTSRPGSSPILAPKDPRNDDLVSIAHVSPTMALVGVYPNPTVDQSLAQIYLYQPAAIHVQVLSLTGQKILDKQLPPGPTGLQYLPINLQNAKSGTYILKIGVDGESFIRKIIKL